MEKLMNPEDISRGVERCPIPLENPADVSDVLDFVVRLLYTKTVYFVVVDLILFASEKGTKFLKIINDELDLRILLEC